ncbi:hypothetical protein [Nonomuraea basaltis]|uniref:hypothetical protein n=1 Tax=Nonomuraea basaltis TaxID=2495887 RepID=UPI00110C7106|nr:hypothetical protein [Nonomuraea basaltis]TMR90050.1 hypothetical protein EJK15_57305 [Nonomuraea basaltis]
MDPTGDLVFTVAMYDTDQGAIKTDSVTSTEVNLADGTTIGEKSGSVQTATLQLVTSQTDVLIGRTASAPAGTDEAIETMALVRGTLGQLRFWNSPASLDDLFPELADAPQYGPPPGLAAQWAFREQEGMVADDPVGGCDGILTSSAPWCSLRDTSTVEFVANGSLVASVVPYGTTLEPATNSQFSLGAPAEGGVPGLQGDLGPVSLWGLARTPETIRDQRLTPRTGDEPQLLAYWDFSAGGIDRTGGGNDRARPSTRA